MAQFKTVLKVKFKEFSLSSNLNLTSVGASDWEDTTISMDLPSAGKYGISFSILSEFYLSPTSTFDNKWVDSVLYDTATESYISHSRRRIGALQQLAVTGDYFPQQYDFFVKYESAQATDLQLHINTHSFNPNITYFINKDYTSWSYVKYN